MDRNLLGGRVEPPPLSATPKTPYSAMSSTSSRLAGGRSCQYSSRTSGSPRLLVPHSCVCSWRRLVSEVGESEAVFAALADACVEARIQVVAMGIVTDSIPETPLRQDDGPIDGRRWLEPYRVRDVVLDWLDFVEQGFVYLCGSVVVVVAEAFVGALKRPLD